MRLRAWPEYQSGYITFLHRLEMRRLLASTCLGKSMEHGSGALETPRMVGQGIRDNFISDKIAFKAMLSAVIGFEPRYQGCAIARSVRKVPVQPLDHRTFICFDNPADHILDRPAIRPAQNLTRARGRIGSLLATNAGNRRRSRRSE